MIEDKLIQRGITREEIDRFSKLPKHNSKKDVFRMIVGTSKWPDSPDGLVENLIHVLAKIGIEDFPNLNPNMRKSQFKYLGEERYNLFVAQEIAGEMLDVLKDHSYSQYDNSLTLDRLYQDTIKEIKQGGKEKCT